MKNKIEEIIKKFPRHYPIIIKKDMEMNNWVIKNSLIQSEKYIELIYSAIKQESNICNNGNKRQILRFSEGWAGCGPASACLCTKQNISAGVLKTKSEYTDIRNIEINTKRENTLLKKYGFKYNSQRPEVKKILSNPKISELAFTLLSDRTWLENEYVTKQRTLVDIADEVGVYYGTVGEYCRSFEFTIRQRTNYSKEENRICNFLDTLGIWYIRNDWQMLGTKELDIYIPDYNLGIEVNGLYWHSFNPSCKHTSKFENKNQHIEKLELAESKNINLVQFTDFEINNKKEIIDSILLTKLGMAKKIYARKCEIRHVLKEEEKKFLSLNHLQGFTGSNMALGLYLENELVTIMTFGKSRFSKIADIELIRVASKLNHIVIGGSRRLFNEAKKYHDNKKIVSYCDRSKFGGALYKDLGFICNKKVQPGYFWTDGNYVISRQKCQHKNLSKWLKNYDKNKSETANLFTQGYRRYWDCGQQTWILDLSKK